MRLRLHLLIAMLFVAAAVCAQPVTPAAAPDVPHAGKPKIVVHTRDDRGDDNPFGPNEGGPFYHAIQAPPFGDHLDLRSVWLFRKGTPARGEDYASPALDDSQWIAVDTIRPLFSDMIFDVNEIWYRTHVHLPAGARDMALSLAGVGGSYRVIVNGRSLGGHGLMSGSGEYLISPSDTFLIPNDLLAPAPGQPPGSPSDLTIAVHLFAGTVSRITFGFETGISAKSIIFLGPSSILLRDQRYFAQTSSAATGAILTVWAIVLILAIALSALVPQVRVYPVLAVYAGAHLLAPAPGQPPGSPSDLTIAVHLFAGTVSRITFGFETGISAKSIIFLGPSSILLRDQRYFAQTSSAATGAILTVWAIVLILAIALAALVPQVRVYPVLAVYAGAHLLARVLADIADSNYLSHTHWVTWPQNLALVVTVIAALELCRLIAGSPRRIWLTLLEAVYAASIFTIYPATWGIISYYFYSTAYQVARFALIPAFVFFVIAGVARRRVDAIILAATGLLYGSYALAWFLLSNRSLTNLLLDTYVRSFAQRVTPASMVELAFILGFLVVLIVHTLRIIRERSLIATEMQAARTMQQLLLARSSDPTPGFIVETAYLPAGDVGGDFFLAGIARSEVQAGGVQAPAHDLFAIVGDVSGKGLKAAMNVSMILGVIRREPSRSPATVLCSLNEALLAPTGPVLSSENARVLSDTGFTTACCVRLTPTGHYTIANAGHLPPYLVGTRLGVARAQELSTPPALPLGLAADQEYEVIEGRLAPGERLVLLSDGVPEARSAKGQLFGFERTLPLVLRPANEIATTAFAFGQEDDITVLTLACNVSSTNQPPPPLAPAPSTPAPPPPPMPSV